MKPGRLYSDGRGGKAPVNVDSEGRCVNEAHPGLVVCERCAAFYGGVERASEPGWPSMGKRCFYCRDLILGNNTVEVPEVNDYGPKTGLNVDYYWAHANCAPIPER